MPRRMVHVEITKNKGVRCRQKMFYRRLIPITARAVWRDVDVGNDQLCIPYISLYGKLSQVGIRLSIYE